MATNVTQAFNQFMKETVNLDQSRVARARDSRKWLLDKIGCFPDNDATFPFLHNAFNLNYGSFERKTKTRPLDDIDMMVGLGADGCSYNETTVDDIKIHLPDNYSGRFNALRHTTQGKENTLSSTRVINKFVKNLGEINQYSRAEIKRTGEAATLKLISYEWNFDLLPCFMTTVGSDGNSYYLIPNGDGDWRKTDPRKDRARLSSINQACNGNVLNVIRALKYWNQRPNQTRISSYLLETMISDYYKNEVDWSRASNVTGYVDIEIEKVLSYLTENIFTTVKDPKNISYDINYLNFEQRLAMSTKFNNALEKSSQARLYESLGKEKEAIKKWQEFFGNTFPDYTE